MCPSVQLPENFEYSDRHTIIQYIQVLTFTHTPATACVYKDMTHPDTPNVIYQPGYAEYEKKKNFSI